MKYRVIKEEIFFEQPDGSERKVNFGWPVVEVLEVANMLVVRTDPKPGSCDNCNVFGVALDGTIQWQVGPQQYIYDDSPYTGITLIDDGIKLSNWDGTDLVVDAATGDILSQSQGK
jgi:hypothetical protein